MKKIEITIGDFFYPFRFSRVIVLMQRSVEKIPGLEALVQKISDSISSKSFSKTYYPL
jgi:hypothetical protein